jgi:hypothetical protein
MRKLIWCCSAATVLAAGSFLSLAYYAYCCPDSLPGRTMRIIAEVSAVMQPLSGLTSLAVRSSHANAQPTPGSIEECVPEEPQPIAPEQKVEEIRAQKEDEFLAHWKDDELDAAPIVIGEDDPMPREVVIPNAGVMPIEQEQEMPANGSPIFMPYCQDDEPDVAPIMPSADYGVWDDAAKQSAASGEEAEQSVFEEWMKVFKEGKEDKSPAVEELPPPTEDEPQAEPKCQEDPHRGEHSSGCSRVTCPYTGKSYPPCSSYMPYPPTTKKGAEESSEEPAPPSKKPHPKKGCKSKEQCPRTQGVDTMEYRKSDAGLNEYGPGPQQ